jgi:alginate O-acetyltransferase complex protein AlgJ
MSSSSPEAADYKDDLSPEHIKAVFQEFLHRAPAPAEVAAWMRTGSLRTFLEGVIASDEYVQRNATRAGEKQPDGAFLNCWIGGPWERFARPPGDISADGLAIVGKSGHLFIYGGTNDNLVAQRGEVQLPSDWIEQWRALVAERSAAARGAGRQLVCLVVPEKVAVYADCFPQDLTARGPRPVLRLLEEGGLALVYPLQALRDARAQGDTYLLTDSHLTLHGNLHLAVAAIDALGVSPVAAIDGVSHEFMCAGDLGCHFDPPIAEVRKIGGPSLATIVFDNSADIAAVGAHTGTRRVFRHEHAPDQRTVVIFGDSYSIGDDGYHGLSWHLAQHFREVHFVWAPFGWDPDYLDSVAADLVVCQMAERFVVRVPSARVDVRALAEDTLKRGASLVAGGVFED